MDITHIHLVVNHVALFFIPLGLFFYLISRELKTRRLALILIIVGSLFTFVASQSGEGAEEQQEKSMGFNEKIVEKHEEASESAQVLSVILILTSLIGLVKMNLAPLRFINVGLGALTTLALVWTAYQGGQIRHGPESFNSYPASSTQGED